MFWRRGPLHAQTDQSKTREITGVALSQSSSLAATNILAKQVNSITDCFTDGQRGMRVHRPIHSQFLLAADTVFSKTHLEPYSKPTAYFKGKNAPKS